MMKNLRKAILVLMGWVMLSNVASAQNTTTIGAEDNTTAWWSAFSDYFTIEPNKTLTLEFDNFTDKAANYHNWLAVITKDADRAAVGYGEYLVLRADNYAWGLYGNTDSNSVDYTTKYQLSSWYNWETFKEDMNGAHVVLTITRTGAKLVVYADVTASDGTTKYFEQVVVDECGDADETLRAFLTVEGGHLVLDDTKTKITDSETPTPPVTGTVIGLTDKTSGWWGDHSALNTLAANKTLHMEFENFTAGAENCQNWVLVVTDGKHVSDVGYSADDEYLILRSDNYGWGSKYSAGTLALYRSEPITGFDELTVEDAKQALYWSTFRSEMEGAKVSLDAVRYGKKMKITATTTATNGVQWVETYNSDEFVDETQDLGLFLTVDHCYLVIDDTKTSITESEAITDGISTATLAKDDVNAPMFDLAGRRVDAGFKGIVIKNGKKMVVK